jgi:hypothetical protein
LGTRLFALAALIPAAIFADQMQFVSANGSIIGNYYISPYTGKDLTLNSQLTLYCLDFNHDVTFGQVWAANVASLSPANLSGYQYGTGSPVFVTAPVMDLFARYEAAAWLFTQSLATANARWQGVYQYAAWALFLDPSHQSQYNSSLGSVNLVDPGTLHTFQLDVTQALNAALDSNNYGSVNLALWNVVSPQNAGQRDSVQEFLSPAAVPEPSTVVLLATVALLIGWLAFRRQRAGSVQQG